MNSKMIKSSFAGLVLSVSSLANAGLIDFNSMSDVAYLGNSDFTVTSYGGPEADTSLTPLIRQEGGISYLCNSTDSNDTSCDSYPTENIIDFDFDGFLLKMSVLLSEFTNEKDVYGKINKFKYYMISKLSDNVFLCNSVKGFFPETNFYLNKGKITSSYSKNNLNKEQENKIWKFLYYNRDRVAVEHKPSLWELFANNRVSVSIDGFETKMPICDVKWNNGNIIVHVFNGNKKVSLNKTFRKEELWAEVLKNR